jgi:hypothetical protein
MFALCVGRHVFFCQVAWQVRSRAGGQGRHPPCVLLAKHALSAAETIAARLLSINGAHNQAVAMAPAARGSGPPTGP